MIDGILIYLLYLQGRGHLAATKRRVSTRCSSLSPPRMEAKMSLSHAQTNTATLDADLEVLGNTLMALQDMARSLPAGVTVPLDRRAAFIELEASEPAI